jgi:hypothetical protein
MSFDGRPYRPPNRSFELKLRPWRPDLYAANGSRVNNLDIRKQAARKGREPVDSLSAMTTGQLITLLAKDLRPQMSLSRAVVFAMAMGALVSATAFFVEVGFRADIAEAVRTWRFLLKFVLTGTMALAATSALSSLGCPYGAIARWVWAAAAIVLALLIGAIVIELVTQPTAGWMARLIGHDSRICITVIPFLSAGPLLCFYLVLRAGVPRAPGSAGAVAGVAASGIGATFYAANCTDDSPLFVATWYPLAILGVSATACLAGKLLLRW